MHASSAEICLSPRSMQVNKAVSECVLESSLPTLFTLYGLSSSTQNQHYARRLAHLSLIGQSELCCHLEIPLPQVSH